VQLLNSSDNSGAIDVNGCRPTWTAVQTLTTTLNIPAGGRVTLSVPVNTINQVYRDARLRMSAAGGLIGCSEDRFAMRPQSITITALDATWDTAGTARSLANNGPSGGIVHKAATSATQRPFTLRATVVPSTATSYDGSPTVVSGFPACGTLCSNPGSLSFTAASWTGAGVRENATANYSEAGTFTLQLEDASYAGVDASDGSTALQRTVPATGTVEIGRFVPDRFAFTSPNTPKLQTFGSTCSSRSFTYIGQKFWFATLPAATANAVNAAGGVTQNYAIASSTTKPALSESFADGSAPTTLDISGVGSGALSSPSAGTASYSPSSSGTLAYQRNAATPIAPFNAAMSLTVTASDSSENGANQGIITTPAPLVFSSIGFDSGNEFRYGRARMLNQAGPTTVDVPVTLRTEYYVGAAGFTTNGADNCTSFVPKNFVLYAHQPSLTAANVVSPTAGSNGNVSVSGTVSGGIARTLKVLKPIGVVTTPGAVNICLDLDSAAGVGDTTCQAATPANQSFLQGPWSGSSNQDKDPSGRLNLGTYGSQPQNFIFFRENY
jgi:MSHA biogenesis protein MshQ